MVLYQVKDPPQAKLFFNVACPIANYISKIGNALYLLTHTKKDGEKKKSCDSVHMAAQTWGKVIGQVTYNARPRSHIFHLLTLDPPLLS